MKSPGTLINTEDALPTATDSDSVISRFESLYPSARVSVEMLKPFSVTLEKSRDSGVLALLLYQYYVTLPRSNSEQKS